MENGRENSTTEKEFPSLLFFAARMVYYINNNTIMNLEKTVNNTWECRCHKYYGCRKENGETRYYNLCTINNCYHSYLTFSVRSIDYQIKLCISLIKDFSENKDINIFTGYNISKSMNFTNGECFEWSWYQYVFESKDIKYDTFS